MADDPDPPTTAELEQGLRFVHAMSMQTKRALERVEAMVTALARELEHRKLVSSKAVAEQARLARDDAHARDRELLQVTVAPAVDKHAVAGPAIDCASLLPLCHARCCRLTVLLSAQDLDDGLRWDYARPYELRRGDDNYCVHRVDRGCGVYDKRPATCRSYDCRADTRIWIDFDNKIPAAMTATDRDPDLVQLRKPRL